MLKIKLPIFELTFNLTSSVYLHNIIDDKYYAVHSDFKTKCTDRFSKTHCIMNESNITEISNNTCLYDILNIAIPFSNCVTHYSAITQKSVYTIGTRKQWSFIQRYERIRFYSNRKEGFAFNFDTLALNAQQHRRMVYFAAKAMKPDTYSTNIIILVVTIVAVITLSAITWSVYKYLRHHHNNSYPSATFLREPRIDSMYNDINFTFSPLTHQNLTLSRNNDSDYDVPKSPPVEVKIQHMLGNYSI